jgi:hypothetical protein
VPDNKLEAPPVRRLTIALSSTAVLILALAGTALGWVTPVLTANCAPDENTYAWSIHLNPEDNQNIEFSWASDFSSPWTTNFGTSGDHSFTTPRGGSTLYARYVSDHNAKTSAVANAELCVPPPPEAPDLSFSDCEEIGGDGGSITVSGLDEEVFLQINGPTVLTITADGTYPLAPGHYGFRAVFDGQAIDSGTFDIGDCPEGQFNALAAPCPETAATIGTPRIHFVGLLLLLHAWVDGAEAAPNGDGDVTVTPGLHTWEVRAANNVTVLASGSVNVPTCTEGGEEGGTGTPAASLPNSAVSSSTAGAPIASVGFAMLVLGSLGALAFVNGKSSQGR